MVIITYIYNWWRGPPCWKFHQWRLESSTNGPEQIGWSWIFEWIAKELLISLESYFFILRCWLWQRFFKILEDFVWEEILTSSIYHHFNNERIRIFLDIYFLELGVLILPDQQTKSISKNTGKLVRQFAKVKLFVAGAVGWVFFCVFLQVDLCIMLGKYIILRF